MEISKSVSQWVICLVNALHFDQRRHRTNDYNLLWTFKCLVHCSWVYQSYPDQIIVSRICCLRERDNRIYFVRCNLFISASSWHTLFSIFKHQAVVFLSMEETGQMFQWPHQKFKIQTFFLIDLWDQDRLLCTRIGFAIK